MNIERLTKLAEWLEAGAKHERITFDMTRGLAFKITEDFDPSKAAACATSCCIAGAAVQFFGNVDELVAADPLPQPHWHRVEEFAWWRVRDEAELLLDLDYTKATSLFEPHCVYGGGLDDYNDPAWAARTIRRLIATGEVDWEATREASPE